ncbi:MAG: cation-transporting P-type ATPase, partial [Gemmatimonadota bacterium]
MCASRDPAEDGGPGLAREELWTDPEALRTYGAGVFFLAGLALQLAGWAPTLLELPVHDLAAPDLLFVAAGVLGGWNFFPAGIRSARALSLDMNFLMTAAILGAVAVGEFLEAGAIAFLFSVAELLEQFAVDRARRSIESLMDLSPETATVVRDGREVTVR